MNSQTIKFLLISFCIIVTSSCTSGKTRGYETIAGATLRSEGSEDEQIQMQHDADIILQFIAPRIPEGKRLEYIRKSRADEIGHYVLVIVNAQSKNLKGGSEELHERGRRVYVEVNTRSCKVIQSDKMVLKK